MPSIRLLVTLLVTAAVADVISGQTDVPPYRERHRPQFHFSSERNFCNDPNGLLYYDGEYHFFYQYRPKPLISAPKHWGHAVSKDLVHWENLPVALEPNKLGEVFSGSAVIDFKNSTGENKDKDNPVMVAMFTQRLTNDLQYQGIAFSHDKGRTFKYYEGNPIIYNPTNISFDEILTLVFRDPKIIWHKPTETWVVSIALWDRIVFYRSENLKNWTLSGMFVPEYIVDGIAEVPDLIPYKTDNGTVWVHLINWNPGGPNMKTGTQYLIGDFDGYTFKTEQSPDKIYWLDYGPDNYAGVTFNNIGPEDGRVLFAGWMDTWAYAEKAPTYPWKGQFTTIRTLELINTSRGYRLISNPIKELYQLTTKTIYDGPVIIDSSEYFFKSDSPMYIAEFTILLGDTFSKDFGVRLSNSKGQFVDVGFLRSRNVYYIERNHSGDTSFSEEFQRLSVAPRESQDSVMKLKLVVDVASVEMFGDHGLTTMSAVFYPSEVLNRISIFSKDGTMHLYSVVINHLRSIWFQDEK